ncbi:polysaccharide biosynthesis/export family protein [Pseudooceanicola sp. LIPI14-2-Ac024]|uniref:polysaccharide biosynthesis/export family protein n=1 Tax=Pseudooceanicola sp. LIPI14-2-Ac024 TaxID=3344875 RepID=UPI0035CE8ACB
MTGQFVKAVCAVAICALLSACALPRGAALTSEITGSSNSTTPKDYAVVDVTRASAAQIAQWPVTGWNGGYRWLQGTRGPNSNIIRAGDQVDLAVWDSQENSLLTSLEEKVIKMNGITVSSAGAVFVPYIDEVVISGMTPEQARAEIQDRLVRIVPAAQVQLTLVPGQDNSVDLVSGVAKPGTYPLPNRDYRILSALSQGGGIATSLRNPVVRLIRGDASYETRAKDLFASPSRNVVLRGGDQIVVEEDDRYFTSLGASGTEEIIYFDRERISALEAMSMMGGLTDTRANPKGVLVLREYPASALRADGRGPDKPYVVFVIDLTSADGLFAARNFGINPKDTVLVTESPVTAAETVLGLFGRLAGIGNQISDI